MKLGYHVSISGGVNRVKDEVNTYGLKSVQFFIGNPRSYNLSSFSDQDIEDFTSIEIPKYVHCNYVSNISSEYEEWKLEYLFNSYILSSNIKAAGFIIHIGSNYDWNEGCEITKKYIKGLLKLKSDTLVLIEILPGGNRLNYQMVNKICDESNSDRIGICFDTAHAYAEGIDIPTIIKEIKSNNNIKVIHLNNPSLVVNFGSGKDQHNCSLFEGVFDKGQLRNIIEAIKERDLPEILETGTQYEDFVKLTEGISE